MQPSSPKHLELFPAPEEYRVEQASEEYGPQYGLQGWGVRGKPGARSGTSHYTVIDMISWHHRSQTILLCWAKTNREN